MGRKRSASSSDAPLSAEEQQRRERQRELQAAAAAKYAAGEKFINPEKKKRKPLAARRLAERKARRKSEHAAARRAVQKEVKKQKAAAPDVVIVPIFWKGEAKQMARVISACTDVEKALADCGKKILLDTTHKYTPGQKFAHWEHKGVKLRVEVGPREAENNCCTVARTFTPGQPAQRQTRVQIAAEPLLEELERLSELEAPPTLHEDDDDDGNEGAGRSGSDDEGGMEHAAPLAAKAGRGSQPHRGGDDLDDDFVAGDAPTAAADGEDEEDEEDEGAEATQPVSAKKRKQGGASRAEKPRKARVVKF